MEAEKTKCICTMKDYLAMKKNEIMSFLSGGHHVKPNKTETENKYHMWKLKQKQQQQWKIRKYCSDYLKLGRMLEAERGQGKKKDGWM